MKITLAVYKCICCGHSDRVTGEKEDYSEVKVCPKCNGAFIDSYHIAKYKQNNTNKNKLLTIELDSIDSVPRVIYQGEEITAKVKIKFEWETRTFKEKLCPTIFIQHADSSLSDKLSVLKTISIKDPFRDES